MAKCNANLLLVASTFGIFALGAWGQEPDAPGLGDTMSGSLGVVFLIDGGGGLGFGHKMLEKAMIAAGVPNELRAFHWRHGFGRWHADLTDDANFRTKATELADAVMSFRVRAGQAPVYIVAKSGGTAIALAALAQLPR